MFPLLEKVETSPSSEKLKRVNQDVIINSHGKNLLDLCLSSRLRILNGRFLGDSLNILNIIQSEHDLRDK
jgi:hypothetical protein